MHWRQVQNRNPFMLMMMMMMVRRNWPYGQDWFTAAGWMKRVMVFKLHDVVLKCVIKILSRWHRRREVNFTWTGWVWQVMEVKYPIQVMNCYHDLPFWKYHHPLEYYVESLLKLDEEKERSSRSRFPIPDVYGHNNLSDMTSALPSLLIAFLHPFLTYHTAWKW